MQDIGVSRQGFVVTVEIQRPPNNFLDIDLISDLGDLFYELDKDESCRAIVLAAAGKHFSAGANLGRRVADDEAGKKRDERRHLYNEALRLVENKKPIVAAIHGAAIGAGLGLALLADFRVSCKDARFSANFARQGYHPGFGMTCTLPRVVGDQKAAWLFYTGARIDGQEAFRIGLVDGCVALDDVRRAAQEMAAEIAASGPLAIAATRTTLRRTLARDFKDATAREAFEQRWLRETEDFREGVKAMNERRLPDFTGK
ncbi:enoyl-CoA hydratase/isomerase family protein [Corticibacterium sp. UT-5YL-CI-8]|nr:enoyl-CoA hydratase/isomerase family protein [Tianweitania sp. UT-5YL-CI-8]